MGQEEEEEEEATGGRRGTQPQPTSDQRWVVGGNKPSDATDSPAGAQHNDTCRDKGQEEKRRRNRFIKINKKKRSRT